MLARVQSFVLQGIDASPCEVEINIDERGIEERRAPTIVGLPDTSVRESTERVKSALSNAGFDLPWGRMTVNLAPADVRKECAVYELPMAVGMLLAAGVIAQPSPARAPSSTAHADQRPEGLDHRKLLFAGELALDGRVRPIRGAIALAALARARGFQGVVVPADNADEAGVVQEIEVHAVRTLTEVVGLLTAALDPRPHPAVDIASLIEGSPADIDFAEVRGQEAVKRALTIAAAGEHNLLMLGPPGTGKTMMAKALPGILPLMSPDEALEVTRVFSAAGKLIAGADSAAAPGGLVTRRPVRMPHHTASAAAIIGGGIVPRPGEISLAHRGVLFLDELAEFPRFVLDTLRQPLEDGHVTISRAHGSVRFPASFMLIAAMNPTPKGTMPDTDHGRREMERYLARVSGPLIDRVDIHVEVPAVPWKDLQQTAPGTSTTQMRDRVFAARRRQRDRQGPALNARLSGRELDALAPLDDDARTLLGQAMTELGLSARAYDKLRRVSRTIADLDDADSIGLRHISEAIQYRLLDRRL
ncbi:MAG: YifB family Mg chelatase-like AAA ATPase [Planctomycetota bacterium]|nr:YifB family Mg chelatase-like AAA ATPase [Planctomycetota bacterium]